MTHTHTRLEKSGLMGCAAKRHRFYDRIRPNLGEGSRLVEAAAAARRAARRAKRLEVPIPRWRGSSRRRSNRELWRNVLKTVTFFEQCPGKDPYYGAEMLTNFVGHPRLKPIRKLTSVKSAKEQKACDMLVQNLNTALADVKGSHTKNQIQAKQTALSMAISQGTMDLGLGSVTARVLGLRRGNMRCAALRRTGIMAAPTSDRQWGNTGQWKRSDRMPDELKEYIKRYWHENTRPSPMAKDTVKNTQKQYLHLSQEHFESEKLFGDIQCPGQRAFEYLKLFYVYQEKDRSVCCCKYHVEIDLLKKSFNALRKLSHPPSCTCDCVVCKAPIVNPIHDLTEPVLECLGPDLNEGGVPCDCVVCEAQGQLGRATSKCTAHSIHYDSVRATCAASLCPKKKHEPLNIDLHELKCIQGNCLECGFSKRFPICHSQEQGDVAEDHHWIRFEQVGDGKDEQGREKTRPSLVQKTTSKSDFVDYLQEKIPEFVRHDFTYRWQDLQFKKSIEIFPVGTVLSVIDYAENYTMAPQDEIQADHWTSTQVTILVHIVYYHLPESTHANRCIAKACHYYVSDDRKHDSHFVQGAFKLLDTWLHDNGVHYDSHWVWSDGAPTQFKNNIAFYFVARYPKISGGKRMLWSFFGPGHGKGEHDGMGAIVKRWLRHYQLDRAGRRLENAESVVLLLRENLELGTRSTFHKRNCHASSIKRIFHHVQVDATDRSVDLSCASIPGTRNKIFQIMGCTEVDHTILHSRPFACYCPVCVFGNAEDCVNRAYTGGGWEVHKLVPKGDLPPDCTAPLHEDEDSDRVGMTQATSDYDQLANLLQPGSYFAVRCMEDNHEGVDYYILQCVKGFEVVSETKNHFWDDTTFQPGDTIVSGTYMKRVGSSTRKYKLEPNREVALIYSHLLVAINLPVLPESLAERRRHRRPMTSVPGQVVYNLPDESHEAILQQLTEPSEILALMD